MNTVPLLMLKAALTLLVVTNNLHKRLDILYVPVTCAMVNTTINIL